jgi:hypothetical protein
VTKINEVSLGLIIITNTLAYFAVGSVVSKVSLGKKKNITKTLAYFAVGSVVSKVSLR